MTQHVIRLILLLTTMYVFQACNNSEDTHIPPPQSPSYELEKSQFCIPVVISLRDLETKLDIELNRVLLDNKKIDKSTRITVTRLGKIKLAGNRGRLQTSVSLKVELHKKKLIKLPPIYFTLDLHILSNISVKPDWNVVSSSGISHFVWHSEPHMEVLGADINLKGPIEKLLEQEKDYITRSVDKAVFQKVTLRKAARRTWDKIQKEHNLLKANGDTLLLNILPSSISYISKEIHKDKIVVNIRVDARMSVTGKSAKEVTVKNGLPDLLFNNDSCSGLDAQLLTVVKYDDISSGLNKHLSGYDVEVMNFKYKLRKVQLEYRSPFVHVQLKVSGANSGVIGANVLFSIDTLQEHIDIAIHDVEVIEGDVRMSIATKLLDYYVSEKLRTFDGFEYNYYLKQLPSTITQAIESGKSGKLWHPEFDTLESKVSYLAANKDGISFILTTQGKGTVVIDSLKPKSKIVE